MHTPAANALQEKRMREICWWFKPEHEALQETNAVAWETLRRTTVFAAFFNMAGGIARQAQATYPPGSISLWQAVWPPIRELIYANKPTEMSWHEWLPLGNHDPVKNWAELFFRDCKPELDWLQLGDARRHSVGFNSPLLPRQERPEGYSRMHILFCELERDPETANGERVKRTESGLGIPMKPLPESGIRVLPDGVESETYVVIMFELGQGAEALERQLEGVLNRELFPGHRNGQPCMFLDGGDFNYKWQTDLPSGKVIYPKLWADSIVPDANSRTREAVVTIPSRQSPFVMCWIPARNDWKLVQSRFHNAVREENRAALEKTCAEYWSKPEVVPGQSGEPAKILPAYLAYTGIKAGLKRKPANLSEFWTGLTAFEYRQAGVKFDQSALGQEALRFFKEHGLPDDPDLIRPALAIFNERLREIDSLYTKLV